MESYSPNLFETHSLFEVPRSECESVGSFVEIASEISSPFKTAPPFPSDEPSSKKFLSSKEQTNSKAKSQFPDIEKCIPRWKQIFPWVCWCSEDSVLYCLHCRELLRKSFPHHLKKSNVMAVTNSDKIFTVAKTLRNHHDSPHHIAAIYLYSHSNLVSFVSLFNNHYKDMKHETEVIEAIRSMFNYSELQIKGFVKTVKELGLFIEQLLVESLKESRYFSIVADQCRGILILRWVNKNGQIGEHVFWSYLLEWNMTPLQYLKKFGIDMDRLTLYIANSLCQQCSRCQNLSIMPASLPPRPPSTLSFANILWNLDFLRPLTSLTSTISKLFRAYPYKFAKKFEPNDLSSLVYFNLKPTILIKVMNNFDDIKTIASEIYESRSYVEALGLAMVNLKSDDKHKKILSILQEIIDTVKEATVGLKITDQQIVKLNQAYGSLKACSAGAQFISYGDEQIKNQSDKIWEFLYFVEKFIDENQKSVYYNGRDRVGAFTAICCTKSLVNLDGLIVESKLFYHFSTVFEVYTQVLKNAPHLNKLQIYKNVKNFHNYLVQSKNLASNCIDIILLFHSDTQLQTKFREAYEIFLFCATMPFQMCQIARSLFVSFVIEQRLESSVWARMGSDLKPWLLYLQHELSFVPPQKLLSWWLQSFHDIKNSED